MAPPHSLPDSRSSSPSLQDANGTNNEEASVFPDIPNNSNEVTLLTLLREEARSFSPPPPYTVESLLPTYSAIFVHPLLRNDFWPRLMATGVSMAQLSSAPQALSHRYSPASPHSWRSTSHTVSFSTGTTWSSGFLLVLKPKRPLRPWRRHATR